MKRVDTLSYLREQNKITNMGIHGNEKIPLYCLKYAPNIMQNTFDTVNPLDVKGF